MQFVTLLYKRRIEKILRRVWLSVFWLTLLLWALRKTEYSPPAGGYGGGGAPAREELGGAGGRLPGHASSNNTNVTLLQTKSLWIQIDLHRVSILLQTSNEIKLCFACLKGINQVETPDQSCLFIAMILWVILWCSKFGDSSKFFSSKFFFLIFFFIWIRSMFFALFLSKSDLPQMMNFCIEPVRIFFNLYIWP